MMMNTKGSLALQVIVVAVISLIVLVVVTFIFTGRMHGFSKGLKHCDTVCMETAKDCTDAGYDIAAFYSSCEDRQGNKFKDSAYCCMEKDEQEPPQNP